MTWSNRFSFFSTLPLRTLRLAGKSAGQIITAETQSTQRRRREEKSGNRKNKAQITRSKHKAYERLYNYKPLQSFGYFRSDDEGKRAL